MRKAIHAVGVAALHNPASRSASWVRYDRLLMRDLILSRRFWHNGQTCQKGIVVEAAQPYGSEPVVKNSDIFHCGFWGPAGRLLCETGKTVNPLFHNRGSFLKDTRCRHGAAAGENVG